MFFTERTEAGERLAARLQNYANRKDAIVLGIPRGVPVAYEVVTALRLPLVTSAGCESWANILNWPSEPWLLAD